MSNGDFGAELQHSVSEHLEEIQARLAEAKARIADGIAGIAPPTPDVPADVQFREPDSPNEPSRRYNVSFDDVPTGDAIPGHELDDEGIPVWEDPA